MSMVSGWGEQYPESRAIASNIENTRGSGQTSKAINKVDLMATLVTQSVNELSITSTRILRNIVGFVFYEAEEKPSKYG